MKTFSLSANIEAGLAVGESYIVTPNVQKVVKEILDQYRVGVHTFCIIGTYGTGKSCFLLNFEKDFDSTIKHKSLLNPKSLSDSSDFEILNILGDFKELDSLLKKRLTAQYKVDVPSSLDFLKQYQKVLKSKNRQLIIAIDEFGKILEHAAKVNPEGELYFLQKLAEVVNAPSSRILLLTTLHQNFSAYASRLTSAQKNEWNKVKGRFKEVVFAEPVEQLLYLAAEHIANKSIPDKHFNEIYQLAVKDKFVPSSFSLDTAQKIYPLDTFAAFAVTRAIQRYGQNERSLFSFLTSDSENSVNHFSARKNELYNLTQVYDYVVNNFYSYLVDANADSASWGAIRVAIERAEGSDWKDETCLQDAISVIKAIGLLNLFGNAGFAMSISDMEFYAEQAMGISSAAEILHELIRLKIIRYAEYKHRLLLFEGTDINIEDEVIKASSLVPVPQDIVEKLMPHFKNRIVPAKSAYYEKGTPRYFEYQLLAEPIDIVPCDDVDGYIEVIVETNNCSKERVAQFSTECEHAILFAVLTNTDSIIENLHKIDIYDYIEQKVLLDKTDRVALREIENLRAYEKALLQKKIIDNLYSYSGVVLWYYKGQQCHIKSQRDFNILLSSICNDVYSLTPTVKNELFNRQKLSGSISAARVKYLSALVNNGGIEDLGFETDKFPPEKTIYNTLLKNTGLHINGVFTERPTNEDISTLWDACESFLKDTAERPRKISDLIKLLSGQPFKMKQGFLDFWIPTYLFLKRQDYSLYGSNGAYIPNVNMEFFDILKKHPSDFTIKAFAIDGVKIAFYNQYRRFINQSSSEEIKGDKFIETIKPFFYFYNHLNPYEKQTKKFDSLSTLKFRDVLAKAKDPEKTFFEDLPEALGYDKQSLQDESFVQNYCSLIEKAIRELRSCYSKLIDRLENRLIDGLGLESGDYRDYVEEIHSRLSCVKTHLLTDKQKDFYNHAMAVFDNRREWFQSICYAAMDQPLERLRDDQEEQLADNLVFLFRECEKQAVISKAMAYSISSDEEEKSNILEAKISKMLSGDDNLDVYTLIKILRRMMK